MGKGHHCNSATPAMPDDTPLSRKVREIRQSLYLSMNGVLSSELRERGVDYRLSYGVRLPVLKSMAQKLTPDAELADRLWQEDVRELKILAILLHPQESFGEEKALKWVESVRFSEIAALLAMYRLSLLPNPLPVILHCLGSTLPLVVYTGYNTFSRWYSREVNLSDDDLGVVLNKSFSNIICDQLFLFNGALMALKKIGATDIHQARSILERVESLTMMNCDKKHQIIDDLKFEFEYYLQTVL